MKIASPSYCKLCGKSFTTNEVIYYIPTDNTIVCDSCAEKSDEETHVRLYEENNE